MKRSIENDEFGDLCERLLRAYHRRLLASNDEYDMKRAAALLRWHRTQLKLTAVYMATDGKVNVSRLCANLGITIQAFYSRWKPKI